MRVLFIGGTGTISSAICRKAAEPGESERGGAGRGEADSVRYRG